MSEKYIVSARKYRPATFDSVVGQQNLTATLKSSIRSGRLAHAYLFCGPRGVGKTSCARIFARTINCLSPTADGEACGECESCLAIERGNSYNLMELDAASNNSVDDIRAVTDQVAVPPQIGKYRVFIIDEVHMLSSQAFNAFLKTLEEPPSYAIFILATTEKHKVLPTILSRCQIFDFKRITIADIVDHLASVAEKEGITADRRALGVIARKADGAMRDALSIFDQVAAACNGNITYEAVLENLNVLDYEYFFRFIEAFAKGDAGEALLLYKDIRDRGFDSLSFVNSLAQHVRDLMVAVDPRTVSLLEMPEDSAQRLVQQARSLPLKWYFEAMKLLNDCDLNYRTATSKQLLVELTLIRLSQLVGGGQSPFEGSDRAALRNPSEPPRAISGGQQPAAMVQPSAQPAPESAAETQAVAEPAVDPEAARDMVKSILGDTPRQNVAPRPAPAKPATPAPARPRPASFNINGSAQVATGRIERQREPFTDSDFLKAWHDFIDTVPDRHILVSAMRNSAPARSSELEFNVMVDHPAQQQAFEGAMAPLLAFLRERLRNDFLTLHVTINPEKEVVKPVSPREFLEKTVNVNPPLANFLKSLNIEIL
ncbi:MAG: DNA polymerase III subunit gamma/tau [Muribaculaceae bacterium]|nr:DNA polymerase III subunit gamma/tau [Muribaculaceae bacterium]